MIVALLGDTIAFGAGLFTEVCTLAVLGVVAILEDCAGIIEDSNVDMLTEVFIIVVVVSRLTALEVVVRIS